ncbi:MAG: SxtJ family membrane protein [Elioraea sp.]|nr:SxtJ family membrane protein [Elioraea sp.]MDW8442969.1 SxtJ family membrane protein [Acetobacteraceae bacterium]
MAKRQGAFHEDYAREEDIVPPSERAFGLTVGGILCLIAAVGVALTGRLSWISGPLGGLGLLLVALALAAPRALALPNRAWLRFGLALSAVVTPVVLGLVFFLVVTPIGLALRLAGKRPLALRFDPARASYWEERRTPPGPMRRQF